MGSYDAAMILLDHGVDVNARNRNGAYHSHQDSCWASICSLYDLHIAQNNSGETALHCAASENRGKLLALLISRGAVLSLLDKEGQSALHKAAQNDEDVECVAALVKAGS